MHNLSCWKEFFLNRHCLDWNQLISMLRNRTCFENSVQSNSRNGLLWQRIFFFFLQSWITQSLFQPRRTLCSVVAMVPMDMCTWNSWVTLEPLLGSWSHQEENYIAMKTRVASKLSLLLVLILLLLPLLRSCCWSRGHDCENCELQCKYQ